MFDFSRTAAVLPRNLQDVVTFKNGGVESLDNFAASTLPRTMSRARVVHNEPFFIGVAGTFYAFH
jgi:hypothetical protein